jgi:hypothetical protein
MMLRGNRSVLGVALASALGACVAPNVVVVDQRTALEQQAAGGYPALENDLAQAGMAPSPEPFAREELAAGREPGAGAALGDLTQYSARGETDADTIDGLLLQHCIGEGLSGLLEPRASDCIGTTDSTELARVVGRENLHRRQLWSALAKERGKSSDDARAAWREIHLEQVPCGAWLESAGGSWGAKAC